MFSKGHPHRTAFCVNDKKFTCSMIRLLKKLENNRYLDTNGKEGLSSVSKLNEKIFNENF